MRKLIAGFKVSLDGKIESNEGYADWVDAWSEDYGLTSEIDTCLLGGAMYPGYEAYWSALAAAPQDVHPMTEKVPTPAEVSWSQFASQTPHLVLSKTQTQAQWAHTRFIRSLKDIDNLKQQPGKAIYLMGGAQLTQLCIEADLLDEIRLIVYPVLIGEGKNLFSELIERRQLKLLEASVRDNGLLFLRYSLR
ncbi:dihydrofolate reductase family protein [Cellvibrio sp.]|uniref:dihydrofolate reductase family protein n=1 Tax=Cellvibrio sp. TaxID=1965322 RepID=UPI0039648359